MIFNQTCWTRLYFKGKSMIIIMLKQKKTKEMKKQQQQTVRDKDVDIV